MNRIRDEVMDKSVKFDDQHYLTLAGLLRDIGSFTDRKSLKIQLNRLYEKTSRQDGYIVEMFTDLLSNLPNLTPTSPVGELQLTVNYLNPCLCHLLHHPEIDKHLIWLNRKDANTCECRPDGILSAIPRRNECITLGYLEVKASDVEQSNPELAFQDLARLGIFSRQLSSRKSNSKVISIQCIGPAVVFYLVFEQVPGVTIMAEILTIEIPRDSTQIGSLLTNVDDLKRVPSLSEQELVPAYRESMVDMNESPMLFMQAVNPKKRKQPHPSFSLV